MNTGDAARRPRFAGLCQIARYNWPQYAASAAIILAAAAWLILGHPGPSWLLLVAWLALVPGRVVERRLARRVPLDLRPVRALSLDVDSRGAVRPTPALAEPPRWAG